MIEMSGEILLLMSHWLRAGLKRIDAARFAVIIGMLVIKILFDKAHGGEALYGGPRLLQEGRGRRGV